jgi:resuscitation-promoting factor RpfB
MVKLLILPLILASFLPNVSLHPSPVIAQQRSIEETLRAPQPIHTTSRFETKLFTEEKILEREIVIKDDPDRELDEDKILAEGKDGLKTTVWKISYYEGKEYSREVVSVETTPPEDKIASHGTKIVWRTLDTPDGTISYWRKMRVWATHYDSHCLGCNDTTAIGMKQGKGVIAVDPKVIKLRSKVYIPGYGQAIAGDTGGAIKGNIIDLGFPDARTSGWSSRFVDVYLQ